MLILMTSPDAVAPAGVPNAKLVAVLNGTQAAGHPVGIISNHQQPAWFQGTFGTSGVQFLQVHARQDGDIVTQNAKKLGVHPYDVLVLASKPEDVQMGKNGQAVLIAAGWVANPQVTGLGIKVQSAAELQEMIGFASDWKGHWWFEGKAPAYAVCALSDLSSYGKNFTQQDFAKRLTNTVKNGGGRLNALLAVTARSLLIDGVNNVDDLVWGVYPSSGSDNTDNDTLCDFTHRLRTTVSRVRFTRRGQPLFIRHTTSAKRSLGGGGDRTDPSGQIQTIHLNPYYKDKGRLHGKNVIVVDDCTTYGVSFGVAAAFLIKAGAASVAGIALGKFGNALRQYNIKILTDPFAPVANNGFEYVSSAVFGGNTNPQTQIALQNLIT